ncbi:M48 family metallopeptidase [Colwellia hornerae]|uniref:M48 family metallopeptidase n=1 Tax=Colwellia hornerae TaxID=89402 RepID=A0A5C6QTF6_9GAMM|nr:SprT family zinc-dependent metalloprotease [Colwellia hornerae]TWX57002.1 M48 family metallopeptidase [Colwellia hornerae]TWX62273.1 M48 family metallopeptidase [Colwellia hornerae]TWX72395.1 M48 family metallopeptidase [Colwellia hornerae]
MLSYQLIRSAKRKTVGLQVKHGKIIIRAPKYVSEDDIANIVNSKSLWLQRKIAEQHAQPATQNNYYQKDSQLLINGELKTLDIHYGLFPEITLQQDIIIATLASKLKIKIADNVKSQDKYVKQQLEAWLKQQTHAYIDEKLSHFAEKIGVLPKSFKVRLYKSRWGSCNSRSELSFSSLLAMTPKWIIDYVIVHELCHLRHMNHSTKFWQLVALNYPNYGLAKTWLKSHQNQLQWPTI